MPACRAAPRATTSLTASELSGGLPVRSRSICPVIGMCVEPPTSSTRSTCSQVRPAWRSTCCVVSRVRISRSRVRFSNSVRRQRHVSTLPPCVQVIVVCGSLLRVRLARSAAACRLASDCGSTARVGAVLFEKLRGDVIDDAVVPVLAAEPDVALDGQGLEALLRQANERHVEGAAAEVVDEDGLLLVGQQRGRAGLPCSGRGGWKRVGQGGRGRLVEDVEHVQAGDAAGVLGGLAAGVVEIGRHGDDGLAGSARCAARRPGPACAG